MAKVVYPDFLTLLSLLFVSYQIKTGVYFTRNLSYARSYAKMAASSNKSTEYFVICCVIPGFISFSFSTNESITN